MFFSAIVPCINNHGRGLKEKLKHVLPEARVYAVTKNWLLFEVEHKSYGKNLKVKTLAFRLEISEMKSRSQYQK